MLKPQENLILVYLGPSLPLARAREILPEAVYRPPAKQGDILSDLVELNPTYIILIDGCFRENLSVWHKELVFALQYPGVNRIYGAASIGALRAAECDFIGMVGVGQIYSWYRDGITEDDSEVALTFSERSSPQGRIYYPQTVPLCNIRAATMRWIGPDKEEREEFFRVMQRVNYMDRTPKLCEETWGSPEFPYIDQKAADSVEVLSSFLYHKPEAKVRPVPEHLSTAFHALYDRDRRVRINMTRLAQQHIDSYCLLNHPEHERICWDSSNQELALILCNHLNVTVCLEDIERENQRFQSRCNIETEADFEKMLKTNGWTLHEYQRLQIQNARIRKLQHSLTVSKLSRHNTSSILDYLRTHQSYDYWASEATKAELILQRKGVDDWQAFDLKETAWKMLGDHCEAKGIEIKSNQEEYLLETGFVGAQELAVALMRLSHAQEDE